MKKALSLVLALVMCLSLCACGAADEGTTSAQGPASNKSGSYRETMTAGQIEDEVIQTAIDECLDRLEGKGYNLNDTKYKIGQISEIDDFEYEVSGTLYLYDKYGSVADIATFTCTCIWIDEYGRGVSVGSVNIDC